VPTLLNAESSGIQGRVCFRGSCWQGEVEGRATLAVAVGPDPSAVRFDDRLADCQSHAAALWLLRKECIKYLVGLAQRKPGPVSLTEISIWPFSPNCDFTVTTPPASVIASIPFSIKFMSTC
jgi:hypothetical protein